MNDDLKFNNIPSAELEKLSRELEEKNTPDEALSVNSDGESAQAAQAEAAAKAEEYPEEAENAAPENKDPDEQAADGVQAEVKSDTSSPADETTANAKSYQSTAAPKPIENNTFSYSPPDRSGEPYPPNTGSNRPPRTNTLRNRTAHQQNGYRYPPNTGTNRQYTGTNTVRNRNNYPQNNYNPSYPQNSYQYYRTNTVRNRNGSPQSDYGNAYSQNGYQYPPNMSYPQNRQQYPQTPYPQGQKFSAASQYYNLNPKELEKLALSKDTSIAGATTITIIIVMYIVAIIIEIVAVFCGVSKDVPDLGNDPYAGFTPMGFYMYEGLTSLLSMFIPALIIMKSSKKKINSLIPFKKIEGKKLFAMVMCGMSLCMVAQLMATLIGVNMSLFGIDIYEGLETATATGFMDFIMGTICTALIPALVEEFAYRGLVAGVLKEHDEMLAVFGSAFLFGMAHGNFGQIPFAFVVGLILGYVRIKTDSMLPGILIHFGNNFYATVVSILGEILPEPYSNIIEAAVILVLIVIGFISTSYLVKNHKDLFKVEKKHSYLTYSEKLKVFFKTGTVIASIIILTIMSFVILLLV